MKPIERRISEALSDSVNIPPELLIKLLAASGLRIVEKQGKPA